MPEPGFMFATEPKLRFCGSFVINPCSIQVGVSQHDARMDTSPSKSRSPKSPAGIDASVERCVSRLGDVGYGRRQALNKVIDTLTTVVSMLSSIGIGDTSALRRSTMAAEAKLAQENRRIADEEAM